MKTKVVRATLDLLMRRAQTTYDWDVIKWTLDDYKEEGYNIQDKVEEYKRLYKMWYSNKRLRDNN